MASSDEYQLLLLQYLQHPKHNKTLARVLSTKETPGNRAKLKYELEKLSQRSASSNNQAEQLPPEKIAKRSVVSAFSADLTESRRNVATEVFQSTIKLQDLPSELHGRFILQKQTFYRIWKLHYDLEHLSEDQRLTSIIEIMDGWDLINTIWQEIDHYQEYGTLLPRVSANEFDDLSPDQRAQRKRTIHSNISKAKSDIEDIMARLKKDQENPKLAKSLRRKQATLAKNSARLIELNKLINE